MADDRVLVLMPTIRDGERTRRALEQAGLACAVCKDMDELCREVARGAGAALVTEEMVVADRDGRLQGALRDQPPWSDLPLVVLAGEGASLRGERLRESMNATLVERPVKIRSLLSVVRAALRSRRHQYAIRDHLETIRRERERYRVTLASIGDAVIATDAEGRVSFMNGVSESLTGWPEPHASGKPLPEVFRIVNEHSRVVAENPALRALREGSVVRLANHTVLIAKDGRERLIDDSAAPMRSEAGAMVGAVLVFRDVTERRRAERQLASVTEESERRKRLYETVLSSTPDFVYVFSLDYRVLYANAALIAMWGAGDPVGKTFLDIGYEPWHAEMHCREIDQVRETRKPIRGEVPFDGTNGRRIYDYIFVPVLSVDGEVEAVAGTTRDITDRQAMEEELRDADRKKDEFIALLAHELRNPLAPIRNGLQVMRLAAGDAGAVAQARDVMDRQLSHMVRLVDDLLDVSRINRNKMELRRTRLALADVISSAVETARPAVEEAGHQLTVALPGAPVYLDADLTRLSQVFSNLLTNSTKYTSPGGRIWLSAELKDEGGRMKDEGRQKTSFSSVAVSVRDTGIGIPRESLASIFDMFSQVDRTIERSTGGLGIGLALVKGLVEMHGGTVKAESDGEGKGSTFTVTLPVVTARVDGAPAASDRVQTSGSGRRMLVVDDSRDGADSLAMMLRLLGNEVQTANDGVAAVEHAEAFRPEVILMDVGMPRMNGLDATRRIREQPWGKPIAIIALTGWGQDDDRERSREAGCDGHLVKPVNLRDLEKLLANLLPRHGGSD
jgi:PAS domain S-box-containing protein